MRFRKIKLKDDKVILVYEKPGIGAEMDEYSVACSDKPLPSFNEAMKGLVCHVREMCELPDTYDKRIEVKGVSLSYAGKNETMGAVITAAMELHNSVNALNLNTPHKTVEFYAYDGDDKQLLTTGCVDAIETLIEEAQKYLNGEREQGGLFKPEMVKGERPRQVQA